MVRVQQEVLPGGVQPARGTKSAAELAMHNDAADIFSLLWIHQAEQGGESQFSSGPAAHNTILATRPDILPILYRGFPHHRRSEQPDDQPDVTPYDVPIFSNVDGRICINFTYSSILPALHELGREMTPEEDGGDRDPPHACWCASRSSCACSRATRRWPTTTPCATRAPTSSTAPTPSAGGWCCGRGRRCRSRTVGSRSGASSSTWRTRAVTSGTTRCPGREGRIAINDYSNVDEDLANLFKAAQAKPKVD